MSDFPHTVLVLGAGAHRPYGFPLGSELHNTLIERLSLPETSPFRELLHNALRSEIDFTSFANSLRHSEEDTIDEFLAHARDKVRAAGKLAVAALLMEQEAAYARKHLRPPESDWIRTLSTQLVSASEDEQRSLAVITFNYDRLLEYRLLGWLGSRGYRQGLDLSAIRIPFPILHVYGSLGPIETAAELTSRFIDSRPNEANLRAAAQGIRIIGEDDEKVRLNAWDWLQNATRVLFLGFGFAESNLAALRIYRNGTLTFRHPVQSRKWFSTCVGLAQSRREELQKQRGVLDFGFQDPGVGCRQALTCCEHLFRL